MNLTVEQYINWKKQGLSDAKILTMLHYSPNSKKLIENFKKKNGITQRFPVHRAPKKNKKKFAIYKGDTFICSGTASECAEILGVKDETVRYYLTPTYKKRLRKRKNPDECILAIRLN